MTHSLHDWKDKANKTHILGMLVGNALGINVGDVGMFVGITVGSAIINECKNLQHMHRKNYPCTNCNCEKTRPTRKTFDHSTWHFCWGSCWTGGGRSYHHINSINKQKNKSKHLNVWLV